MIERSWLIEVGPWSNVYQICALASTRVSEVREKIYFTIEDPLDFADERWESFPT